MLDTLRARLGDTYEIEHALDGGGMSRVFAAKDRALGRAVVIKVMGTAERPVDARRFRQEIQTSAALQHPHIVPVHAAGDLDGTLYFVMPFVEGVSLRARLRDGPLPIGEATRVLRDVAAALHYAHARGIVHRDLKPENVMLSGGSAVVLDFGVAKALAAGGARPAGDTLTGAGYAVGTPRYMAPEQAAGDPNLDHRADIYAFGVLAFEMFTGEPPFSGTPSDVLRRHIAEEPPDIAQVKPSLPAPLVLLVRACLAKSPDERPADASALLDALDGVTTPLTGTRVARAPRPVRRSGSGGRWGEALAVPATYVLAAGGTVAYLFHLGAEQRVREGVIAAGVIGSLLGLPLAVAGGLLLRVVARDRAVR